jgi:hypothetical protein
MKVLNLQCASMHTFEGWFGSEEDYQSQRETGLVACPICTSTEVRKLPSAPRLNLGATAPKQLNSEALNEHQELGVPSVDGPSHLSAIANSTFEPANSNSLPVAHANPESMQLMQAAWMKMVKHVMVNTEDVGKNFAEEARKMHYGESEERNIRGKASFEETQDLLDEGIDVLPLPVPDALKGELQ